MTLPAMTLILIGESASLSVALIFYVIAVIGYFAYEAITTRSIPTLAKMLPGLLAVVVLNVGFIFGVAVSRSVILQPIDVASVTTIKFEERVDSWQNWQNSYAMLNLVDMEITQTNLVSSLATMLNENIQVALAGNHWELQNRTRLRVTFNFDDGRSITRNVSILNDSEFAQHLINYEPYQALYLTVPENIEHISLTFVSSWGGGWHDMELDADESHQLLEVLLAEANTLDFASWYQIFGQFSTVNTIIFDDELDDWVSFEPSVEIFAELFVEGRINGEHYFSHFPITTLTPRALELYQRHRQQLIPLDETTPVEIEID